MLAAAIGISSSTAAASEKLFTGVFDGTGRACSGALQVRAKTIEWRSAFSTCKPTPYEILEKNAEDGPKRIVFRLKKRSSQCLYPVIEVTQASDYRWNVTGYQSLEGFQKKEAPDWSNSPLPERQTLSCPMTGPN
ncbi:hypothetical protein [Acidovorax sp. SUPP3334]|uniref:hypothetical protein n=1 Tax=Acidovorax sp. SUPP3334 TaxID=2920881 RepID=UPI0024E0CB34|nr:hypothetical protein [Acidovorax sp. SUPP3334]